MYKSFLLGCESGPAFSESTQGQINDHWDLVGIPLDIPVTTAVNNVKRFLSEIVAMEIPTSLMCNCDCTYCYIREKWLKNTHVKLDDVKAITEAGWKHLLNFGNDSSVKGISSWGAEPFCNLDTLEYIVDFCIEHNASINLSTNATILNDRVKSFIYKMYKHFIVSMEGKLGTPSFQISLDGPKHIQDTYRPMCSEQSNFDKVMEFIDFMNKVKEEFKINKDLYSLCSTIYLGDNGIEAYKDAINYFTDSDNKLIYTPVLPIRIENSRNFTKHDSELFYETIKEGTNLLIEKSKKTGEAYIDNYAAKLFLSASRIEGWPRCSAFNTQLGLDLDGSMYMCHGPITTTKIKPFHWFGNVIEGIIDYRRYISVMDSMYSDTAFKSICKSCDLSTKCLGSICSSCPPTGSANNFEPVNFNIHMCNAYKKCFPLWESQYDQYTKSVSEV